MKRASIALACGVIWVLTGCVSATPASIGGKPKQYSVPWSGPVAVSALPHQHPESRFNANGYIFDVNLDDFSQHLAELLEIALAPSVVKTGENRGSLQIQVIHLDFMFQGPCYVDYTVTLGNGEIYGLQSIGESKLYDRACRRALEEAIRQILNHDAVARYLEES